MINIGLALTIGNVAFSFLKKISESHEKKVASRKFLLKLQEKHPYQVGYKEYDESSTSVTFGSSVRHHRTYTFGDEWENHLKNIIRKMKGSIDLSNEIREGYHDLYLLVEGFRYGEMYDAGYDYHYCFKHKPFLNALDTEKNDLLVRMKDLGDGFGSDFAHNRVSSELYTFAKAHIPDL
jgi:hypothetical protein